MLDNQQSNMLQMRFYEGTAQPPFCATPLDSHDNNMCNTTFHILRSQERNFLPRNRGVFNVNIASWNIDLTSMLICGTGCESKMRNLLTKIFPFD